MSVLRFDTKTPSIPLEGGTHDLTRLSVNSANLADVNADQLEIGRVKILFRAVDDHQDIPFVLTEQIRINTRMVGQDQRRFSSP